MIFTDYSNGILNWTVLCSNSLDLTSPCACLCLYEYIIEVKKHLSFKKVSVKSQKYNDDVIARVQCDV